MEIVNVEQRSEPWFKLRREKLGASDAGPLLGLSPYVTPHQVWLSKQENYVNEDNPAMRQGRERESEALQLFEKEIGYLMSPTVGISDETSFIMASLDGYDVMDGKHGVEIKCPFSNKAHFHAIHGEIPKYYIAQMQHQMYVAELDEIYFCSYRPEYEANPLYIEIVKRDNEFISDMIQKETDFYFDHMLTGIAPDCAKIEPKTIDTEVWRNLSNEYLRLDRQEKENSKRKDEIKDLLLQLSNMENAKGNGIVLQKIERKGIINYQNIPMLKTMNLEKFRKPGSIYWQVKESN